MLPQTTIQYPSSLLDLNEASLAYAAAAYADRGWPVLPLRRREKTPLTNHGLLDASADPAAIERWWNSHPEANIGLRTGEIFDVLDIDGTLPSHEAFQSFNTIAPPDYYHKGPVSATGRGYHLLFEVSGSRNSAGLLPGLDIRGHNGYIVAPPSIHPLGHRYQWMRDGDLVPVPDWLDPLTRPPAAISVARDTSGQQPILEVWELWEDDHPLKKTGNRYITTCIFHPDDTPSLVIYPDTNSFYCFGCNEWGDAMNLNNFIRTGKLR